MFRNKKLEDRKKDFLEKIQIKYQDQYDLSNINYVNMHTNITYTCNITKKSFTDTPWTLLKRKIGTDTCTLHNLHKQKKVAEKTETTTEEKEALTVKLSNIFIEKAKKVHGSKYDYSKVVYVKAIEKVTIICPVHGEFQQRPNLHLQSHHCFECGKVKLNNTLNKYFESLYSKISFFYIIYCFDINSKEYFYKIGVTKNSVKERYGNKIPNKRLPYNYKLIFISNKNAYKKEQFILNALSKYQYKPNIFFQGHTECIKIHPKKYKRKIKKILKLIK